MDTPNEQKADGMMDEAKGKVKQAAGHLTGNKSLHAEGQMDEAKGDAKQAAGDARKALNDLTD